MTVGDIARIIEAWAPKSIAWKNDNVGLQVGSLDRKVRRVLLALEINREVVEEAKTKKIDLIVTHHPLIYQPLSSISPSTPSGEFVRAIIQNDLTVYSAHTNLDFTRGGVSFALAQRLGLRDVDFLQRRSGEMSKISVFVPSEHVEAVVEAMANAGAGIIGNYEMCSFRVEGTGTFRPRQGAKPFLGEVGKFEKVNEIRLEMLVPSWRITDVVSAMRAVHPYDEVAYDLYPLNNVSEDVGEGAIGELSRPTSLRSFLTKVRTSLGANKLSYTGRLGRRIKRVAVCGGSGGSLLPVALRAGADAFVTADVKYHSFHDASERIALIDAGHYETEFPVLEALAARLNAAVASKKEKIEVFITRSKTNPIRYH